MPQFIKTLENQFVYTFITAFLKMVLFIGNLKKKCIFNIFLYTMYHIGTVHIDSGNYFNLILINNQLNFENNLYEYSSFIIIYRILMSLI